LFAGDTLTLLNDYEARCGGGASSKDAIFHLNLSERAEVTVSIDANFDSVLYRYTDSGSGPTAETCSSGGEASCNDDVMPGITDSSLEAEVLDPGSYYYVVDGFNRENAGRYLLEVDVVPLGP
jgi:hypothetical protein